MNTFEHHSDQSENNVM